MVEPLRERIHRKAARGDGLGVVGPSFGGCDFDRRQERRLRRRQLRLHADAWVRTWRRLAARGKTRDKRNEDRLAARGSHHGWLDVALAAWRALRRRISARISANCLRVSAPISAGPTNGGTHAFGT